MIFRARFDQEIWAVPVKDDGTQRRDGAADDLTWLLARAMTAYTIIGSLRGLNSFPQDNTVLGTDWRISCCLIVRREPIRHIAHPSKDNLMCVWRELCGTPQSIA